MNEQLLAQLLPYLVSGGITIVEDIIATIKGNPQQQGETDDAYIARVKAQIIATGTQILNEDAAAEGSAPTGN